MAFCTLAIIFLLNGSIQAEAVAKNMDLAIMLSEKATVPEQCAAEQLAEYVKKCTGRTATLKKESADFTGNKIYVGKTLFAESNGIRFDNGRDDESWIVKSFGNTLVIAGGGRTGTLYGVYHYLEDVVGVRWWNPFEEDVPLKQGMPITGLSLSGKPAFEVRDIFSSYDPDHGQFTSRCRLGHYDGKMDPKYGGVLLYASKYSVHTFGIYIPGEKYGKTHPEWFALNSGNRNTSGGRSGSAAQPCLTNKEMRREMAKNVLTSIREKMEEAKQKGLPPPTICDVSENDNENPCQCPECSAFVEKAGQSGLILDCINEIADKVAQEFPDMTLMTLAYRYSEKAPLNNIRPRPNVMVVLCDTASNQATKLDLPENKFFIRYLKDWTNISDKIRIWDYAKIFGGPQFPYPSEYTYADDIRLFKAHNVKQLFIELEGPVESDVYDYKMYLLSRFTENPNADFDALSKNFTDGFYGPAGTLFREYRKSIYKAQKEYGTYVSWFPQIASISYLTPEVVLNAEKLFDKGTEMLKNDPARLKRWELARLSLDFGALLRYPHLNFDYQKKYGVGKEFPIGFDTLVARVRTTWKENALLRLESSKASESIAEMEKQITSVKCVKFGSDAFKLPKKFSNIPAERVFDYPLEMVWLHEKAGVSIAQDLESPKGSKAILVKVLDDRSYDNPLELQTYSCKMQKTIWSRKLQLSNVTGPGYNWYCYSGTPIHADSYLALFKSWVVQLYVPEIVNVKNPDFLFDVWVHMKLDGPVYPHGKKNKPNAIWIDRIVIVRK